MLWIFTAAPMATLAELLGIDPGKEVPDDLNIAGKLSCGVLARWCERWPPGVVRVALEAMWDRGHLSVEERDALIALSEDPPALAATVSLEERERRDIGDEGQVAACGDEEIRRQVIAASETGDAQAGGPQVVIPALERSVGRDANSLDALVDHAVNAALAAAPPGPDLDRLRGGLEWLIGLDTMRVASWTTYGKLVTLLGSPAQTFEPTAGDTRLAFLLGQLAALAHAGRDEGLRALVRDNPPLVDQVLDAPDGSEVVAPALTARLEEPRDVARLIALAVRPFPGWRGFARAAQARARELIEGGGAVEAEIVLRALEEALWRWSAGSDGGQGTMGFEREAAAVTVLRAGCRRSRSDFLGANVLLARLDLGLLDDSGRAAASREAALAAAELTGLGHVRFPKDRVERARLIERLSRARPHLAAMVDADPSQHEASLLLGLLAYCEGDDAGAARHLRAASTGLAERVGIGELGSAVRFHSALAQLRLLEPGTDEGAYEVIQTAMAAGSVPGMDELVSAAVALEAHGSPHAGEFLRMVASVAPTDPALTDLVAQRARTGDKDAEAAAEQLGADRQLTLATRFVLLDSALAGADRRRDAHGAERLAGEIDEVLIRANDDELDGRWADTLAANETLRQALEPPYADAFRIGVLRRVGRLDEARGLARSLFHRAAAGTLRAFDAAELLELLREIGAEEDELCELSRLVAGALATEERLDPPLAPVRVVFVGGAEPQEQSRPHVAASIAERYQGMVDVDWFIPGWSSNWPKVAERVEAAYESADAVVLMVLVRTNFGRWVRRTAGEHGLPWVSCTGHGRASMERAIARAVRLASDRVTAWRAAEPTGLATEGGARSRRGSIRAPTELL